MKKLTRKCLIGILLICVAIAGIFVINLPTAREEKVRFDSIYDGKATTLEASYYDVKGSEYAALICPGFSCDRQKLRTIADQFVANGITSMTFDYSGQGASDGVIGFDNAKTEHIPTEIFNAMRVLHEKSGVDYDHMILVGHSMGGRSILRLFTMDIYTDPVGAAILIAPEVDYVFSLQSSIFAGTSDRDEEPWSSYTGEHTSGTNVYLISSTFDDTVSHKSTIELFRRLGGKIEQERGKVTPMLLQENDFGSTIGLCVTGGALHSYQMYAPQIKAAINKATADFTGLDARYPIIAAYALYALWFIGFVGAYLVITSLTPKASASDEEIPVLENYGKFIRRKLLLWLPALIVMFLLCCISVVMPFGSPVMNIIFMGSIAGYGAVLLFAYRKGKFKGTHGKLPKPTLRLNGKDKLLTLAVTAVMIAFMVYSVRAGLYRVMPFNFRVLFWILAGGAMTVGYYVSGVESDMLARAGATRKQKLAYQLIQYVPILLYTLSYIALGSFSGLIEQVQNLMFMYVFALPLGRFFKERTRNRLYGAAVTAFTFQAMMLMSTALISVFR